jgi:AcrR family transcriptional regulator
MKKKPPIQRRAEEPGDSPVRQRIIEAAFAAFMERGFAETSTLEIATRARASKRELYAHFDSKQHILLACIAARAEHLKLPSDLPDPRDVDRLAQTLTAFGTRLLRETTDPTVVAVFRLAIAEAVRKPPELARHRSEPRGATGRHEQGGFSRAPGRGSRRDGGTVCRSALGQSDDPALAPAERTAKPARDRAAR